MFKGGRQQALEFQTDKGHQIVTDDDWGKTMETGIEALGVKVRECLKTP